MHNRRLNITPRLRQRMTYDKFAGGAPRMLALRSHYWLDGASIRAAEKMGWMVETSPIVMEGVLSRDLLAGLIEKLFSFRPDFILSVNFGGLDPDGMLMHFFSDLGVPTVVWVVDDPRTILMDRTELVTPHSVVLTWERAYIPYLQRLGFQHVHWMPLAADTDIFDAEPADQWPRPPAFVGNSMIAFAEREWAPLDQQPVLKSLLEYAFVEGLVNRDSFAMGLEMILGDDMASALDAETKRRLEMLCFIEGTRRLRHRIVTRLLPEGLDVYGDTEWMHITPAAFGWVGYEADLPRLYRECELNLNITSIQMASAVNQRVFDCPAAGGFLLTDAQGDLALLFDEASETAQYDSLDACVEQFRFFKDRPNARKEIAAKARARILNEHTYRHRLLAIEGILRSVFAS